jgi:NNP family nitrate/nitrite transporter-like MFS transporter
MYAPECSTIHLAARDLTSSKGTLHGPRLSKSDFRLGAQLKGSPKRGLAGATLGFFVGFAAVALFGPVAHMLQAKLQMSPMMLGLAVVTPLLSGSLLRIPFSIWVDSGGGRKPFLMLLVLAVLGMTGLLFMFRPSTSGLVNLDGYALLCILGVLCGCGIATFSVGAGQVSYWFPQAEQGWALGVYAGLGNTAPGIFSFLLPLAAGVWGLGNAYWIWLIFLVSGTLAYALLASDAWYFQLRRGGVRDGEARRLASARGQEILPSPSGRRGFTRAIKRPRTWALVALYFVTFGGFLALTSWFPIYWQAYYKLAPAAAGLLTGVFSLSACFARILGGRGADHFSGERISASGLYLLLAGSVLMCVSSNLVVSIIAMLVMATGMGFNNAAVFAMLPRYVPDAIGGAAGWIGGLGAFGGFVTPPLIGLIVELCGLAGYAYSFVIFVALSVGCLTVATKLKERSKVLERFESDGRLSGPA